MITASGGGRGAWCRVSPECKRWCSAACSPVFCVTQGLKSEAHARLVLANGAAARGLMLQHNTRLVISIAKNYRNRGVEMQDLIQVLA